MFSGIIKELGVVDSLQIQGSCAVLGVLAPMFSPGAGDAPVIGDSICISGVCLTITRLQEGVAYFDLASETRRCTILGELEEGTQVNLERSLRFGERLDGHLVQGHVDTVAEVIGREEEENTLRFVFSLPATIADYLVPKGSVAIDGVSLTVGEVGQDYFSVYIIPFTLSETTFGSYQIQSKVNIEADCVARYLKKLAEPHLAAHTSA